MNIVIKYCNTERQYMAQYEDPEKVVKGLASGKYHLRDDGFPIEYREEDVPHQYKTKDMTAAKKGKTIKVDDKPRTEKTRYEK